MSKPPTKYAQEKARLWGKPVPEGNKHGPRSYAARYYGCPCKVCLPSGRRKWINAEDREAPMTHAERQKKLREAKKGKPVPEGVKHGIYTARVYQCPCEVCKAAKKKSSRQEKRRSWRDRAYGHWTTANGVDTICWPPKDAGPDWVCPGCASSTERKEVA